MSLEHQKPSKTSEKMGYFDRVQGGGGEKFIPGTLNGFSERNYFVVSSGKSRDVAIKRPKVCVYLLLNAI